MRTCEFRPAASRAITRTDWLDSRHSFAFGQHYQPDNTHFGALLAHNQDLLQPGPGYTEHPHRDTEILTWVLEGCLAHEDSTGNRQLVEPGMLATLSAGSGVRHAEFSGSPDQPVRLVQMWLSPDERGTAPSYRCSSFVDQLAAGGLVPIASGLAGYAETALPIRRRDATLFAVRLAAEQRLRLPPARYLHLFLTRGSVEIAEAGRLLAGDALRIIEAGAESVTAVEPAELLAWQMASAVL